MVASTLSLAWLIGLTAIPRAQEPARGDQAPPLHEIRRLLQSADPADQAWGAWWSWHPRSAGVELIPDIQALAGRQGSDPDRFARAATGAALEALVQLDAQVPARWTKAFQSRWPVESLILLARSSDDPAPVLIEILKTSKSDEWLGAANLLLHRRSPGLAAALLNDIELKGIVCVSFRRESFCGAMDGMSGFAGDGGTALTPGFPPLTHYGFSSPVQPGALLVANGPFPVFARRLQSEAGQEPPASSSGTDAPKPHHRLRYIAALLNTTLESLPVRPFESRTLVTKSQRAIDSAVKSLRTDIERRFAQLVKELVTKGLVTRAEAATLSKPRVNVQSRTIWN